MKTALFWTEENLDFSFASEVTPDLEALYSCIHCGSCTASCPTANQMSLTPQRITRLIRLGMKEEVLESQAHWRCTSCDACTLHCPREIPILDTIIGLKRYANEHNVEVPVELKLLVDTIGTLHNISGDENEDRLGWSTNLPQPLVNIDQHAGADILLFVGCVSAFYPRAFGVSQDFCRTLQVAGLSVTTMGTTEWCCGYPLYNCGLEAEARELAEHNVRAVEKSGISTMVTTCPSCYYMWKRVYPTLTSLPPSLNIMHSSQLLAELLDGERLKPKPQRQLVTYHDPCDLGRKSGETEAPRHVLNKLPGVELQEMANCRENSLCCGGGGDVKIFSHTTTQDVAKRRIQQVLDIEVEAVVSSCQQCKRALIEAVQAMRQPIKVLDVTELVWRSVLDMAER
jgi:Fe-S oxidoreductase